MAIASVNPATGEVLKTFEPLTASQIEAKLSLAAKTFESFRKTTFADRARMMNKTADILETEKESLGKLMTLEMGKTLRSAVDEAVKCAWGCRYYAENAERFLADEVIETTASRSYIHYQPLGPILVVMPWNYPFWQVFRFIAPGLMAGNVGVLKHASNVPQCALKIEDIVRRAGFPEGAFQTLLIGVKEVDAILNDPRIQAATLTGSEQAGIEVGVSAAKRIKKVVLELGGSDPFIVMPSAELDKAADIAVKARIVNNGQSCIAAKRFIVHEKIADDFEKKFVAAMEKLKVGDPLDETVDIGPLATSQILDDIAHQVEASIKAGAKLLTGGKRIGSRGNFYAPTVLKDIPKNAPVFSEETFGPVASIFRVRNFDEAVEIANATTFGLGASVWTKDRGEADRFIDAIETGQVFVNAMVASDARLPFGGVKHSGYGRELGMNGIREFVNVKTVYVMK